MAQTQVLTNKGKELITSALLNSVIKYLGWGTGTTPATITDAVLVSESTEARVIGTQSQATTTITNDTYRVAGIIFSTATRAITEAGLFGTSKTEGATPGGDLAIRSQFDVINVAKGDGIEFVYTIKFE